MYVDCLSCTVNTIIGVNSKKMLCITMRITGFPSPQPFFLDAPINKFEIRLLALVTVSMFHVRFFHLRTEGTCELSSCEAVAARVSKLPKTA